MRKKAPPHRAPSAQQGYASFAPTWSSGNIPNPVQFVEGLAGVGRMEGKRKVVVEVVEDVLALEREREESEEEEEEVERVYVRPRLIDGGWGRRRRVAFVEDGEGSERSEEEGEDDEDEEIYEADVSGELDDAETSGEIEDGDTSPELEEAETSASLESPKISHDADEIDAETDYNTDSSSSPSPKHDAKTSHLLTNITRTLESLNLQLAQLRQEILYARGNGREGIRQRIETIKAKIEALREDRERILGEDGSGDESEAEGYGSMEEDEETYGDWLWDHSGRRR